MRQKVQSSQFSRRLLGANKARAALGWAQSPEAVTSLKAASLRQTWSGEPAPRPVSVVQPQWDMQTDCRGKSLGILLSREEELWPLQGRGQLRTPQSHLTVPFQSSRDAAAPETVTEPRHPDGV